MAKQRARIKDRVRQLKEQLDKRLRAEDNKIEHAQNYSTKIVSMMGDMAKQITVLQERVRKLERKRK